MSITEVCDSNSVDLQKSDSLFLHLGDENQLVSFLLILYAFHTTRGDFWQKQDEHAVSHFIYLHYDSSRHLSTQFSLG